jgi:hypothetical protein
VIERIEGETISGTFDSPHARPFVTDLEGGPVLVPRASHHSTRTVCAPTSVRLGAHPPMPPATSAVSPVAVFPSPIRRGVSRGNASAPRIDYTSNHGVAHTESGVFLTSWEHGLATFDRRGGPALGRSAVRTAVRAC